jgi:putative glutamine amidotransferase
MKIGVTQKIDINNYGERCDVLDQRWTHLLNYLEVVCVPIPNQFKSIEIFIKNTNLNGIIFTGGENQVKYGGKSPERDSIEYQIIEYCIINSIPIFGVCRGMHIILDYFGVDLHPVEGHVSVNHKVVLNNGLIRKVNSYHRYGATTITEELEMVAKSEDGVIESIRHRTYKFIGVQWHPERENFFCNDDIKIIKELFCIQ